MKLSEFIEQYGNSVLYLFFLVDFGISSSIWVNENPILGAGDKSSIIITMIMFALIPFLLRSYLLAIEEKYKKLIPLIKIYIFFFNVPIFIISRLMNFMVFNELAYRIFSVILFIGMQGFLYIVLWLVLEKHRKLIISSFLIIGNTYYFISLFLFETRFPFAPIPPEFDWLIILFIVIVSIFSGFFLFIFFYSVITRKLEERKKKENVR